jgi:predicted Zn-dependent protease
MSMLYSQRSRSCDSLSPLRERPGLLARIFICVATCLVAVIPAQADTEDLPDIGSPADAILSRQLEAQIGRQVYYSLLQTGTVITDPEIQEYIQDLGMRLAAYAGIDGQRFQFFVVDSPVINAFALPGGYVGMHTGLILATANESELAGVVAHEISHVTQRHIARAVFASKQESTLSLATMLGAILVGVATGADPALIQGAVGAAQGMSAEKQIGFTRSNEYEADRVGLDLLADAGFDPFGMPNFFETMGRSTATLSQNKAPEFLLTHPVSKDRMAETRARARNYTTGDVIDSNGYSIARARIKLLTSSRPETALEYFIAESATPGKVGSLEVEYGVALAQTELGASKDAAKRMQRLLKNNEEIIPLHSAMGVIQAEMGERDEAFATFENAMGLFPRNVPLTVRYAETLMRYGEANEAHDVLLDLLNHVPPTLEQVRLIALAANAAGDVADAHYYMAEYHAMGGNLRLAIDQLQLALASPRLDNVQKARFTARLEQFYGYLPKRPEPDKRNGD